MLLLAPLMLQPTTMTHVEYQRVQHALSNGTPDPTARDNSYVRAAGTWYLMLDSDGVAPDGSGTRHVHLPGVAYRFITKYDQQGRLRGKLGDRFVEIYPGPKRTLETGRGTIGAIDDEINDGQRHIYALVRTVVEHVETHAEGRNRVTCTTREAYWCSTGQGVNDRGAYIPTPISGITTESKPPVPPSLPADVRLWSCRSTQGRRLLRR